MWLFRKRKNKCKTQITINFNFAIPEREVPPLQGDFAKTIFLEGFLNKATTIPDNYIVYLKYYCGITDGKKYFRQLMSEGFFREATSREVFNTIKVHQLKEICEQNNLRKSGKKAELIERLLNAGVAYYDFLPEIYYAATEKSYAFVAEHKDYLLIKKYEKWKIDWKEYDRWYCGDFYNTALHIIISRVSKQEREEFNVSSYYAIYDILMIQEKYEKALEILLRILYIDYSGTFGNDYIENLYKTGLKKKKDILESTNQIFQLEFSELTIQKIQDLKEYYKPCLLDKLPAMNLPGQITSYKSFEKILACILDTKYSFEKIEAILIKGLRKYL